MNERIKELSRQASAYASENPLDGNLLPVYEEKFAQLLLEKFAYDLMDTHAASSERLAYVATFYGVEL